MINDFAQKLSSNDVIENSDEGEEVSDDDDDRVDTSQEGIDDEYLFLLAEQSTWNPALSRELLFVETSLALPRTAICVQCDQDGKAFSKSQLAKHPDDRRCKDCIYRNTCAAYKTTGVFGGKVKAPVDLRTNALPEQLKPTVAAA